MSTKISALDERLQQDINGEEFFPIIDGTVGAYHTYKINLDQLFQSGQGYEKVTSLSVTDGATVASNNTSFTLEYTQEDNTIQTLTIEKYKIGIFPISLILRCDNVEPNEILSMNIFDETL